MLVFRVMTAVSGGGFLLGNDASTRLCLASGAPILSCWGNLVDVAAESAILYQCPQSELRMVL